MKYFRMSYDDILWGIGYTNLMMLLATIPSYKSEKEKQVKKEVENLADLSSYLNIPKKKNNGR